MIPVSPVILRGGSGAQLWPLSCAGFPTQFLSLTGNESLFQQAAPRMVALGADDIQVAKPLIVTSEEHRFLAGEQLREAGIELGAALLEPMDRNTAPALTLAAHAEGQDKVMVVTPADQTVASIAAIPSESNVYAVMERCPDSAVPILMEPLDAGWIDLGAWDAVWDVLPKEKHGNAHVGDVLTTHSRNTLVHASSSLVSLVGVENLIMVETPDAVLVADKARSQDVKHIVAQFKSTQREERTLHHKVHRPWGWYDSIGEGGRVKVKRIQVKPGASLSLQKHHHRAEHWIVVKGTAEMTNGEKVLLLTENQSTYIPLGEVHRLANPGSIPLEIIEVQSGSYLGEDDIVRFEDTYGRIPPIN